MELFDEALNMVKSQMGGEAEGQSGLMGIVMQLINNPQSGGWPGCFHRAA
ncbi:MAG: hypothetical protein ACYCZJ_06250 [Sulfuriferula sp.]